MLIVLSFDKNEAYAEKNCVLALTLGGAIPDSARDTPTTRRPTHITPSSPSLKTGASGRDTSKCVFCCSLPPLNSHLSHLATSHRTLSNVFAFITDAIGYTNTNISISSCDDPTNTTDTIPDCSTRSYVWPSPCRTHPPSAQAVDRSSSRTAWTPAPIKFTARRKTASCVGPREGRMRCCRTAVVIPTVSAEMVRWTRKRETFESRIQRDSHRLCGAPLA